MATKPDIHDLFQQLADAHDSVESYAALEDDARRHLARAQSDLHQAKNSYNTLLDQVKGVVPEGLFAGYAVLVKGQADD